jgi:hypothetical protein
MRMIPAGRPPRKWTDIAVGESYFCGSPKWRIDQWIEQFKAEGFEFVADAHEKGYTITCKRRPANA